MKKLLEEIAKEIYHRQGGLSDLEYFKITHKIRKPYIALSEREKFEYRRQAAQILKLLKNKQIIE